MLWFLGLLDTNLLWSLGLLDTNLLRSSGSLDTNKPPLTPRSSEPPSYSHSS